MLVEDDHIDASTLLRHFVLFSGASGLSQHLHTSDGSALPGEKRLCHDLLGKDAFGAKPLQGAADVLFERVA